MTNKEKVRDAEKTTKGTIYKAFIRNGYQPEWETVNEIYEMTRDYGISDNDVYAIVKSALKLFKKKENFDYMQFITYGIVIKGKN